MRSKESLATPRDGISYDQIPMAADKKPEAWGGMGRSRTEIREDQLGTRVASLLVDAVEKDVISRSQAVDFLDIPDCAFDNPCSGSARCVAAMGGWHRLDHRYVVDSRDPTISGGFEAL